MSEPLFCRPDEDAELFQRAVEQAGKANDLWLLAERLKEHRKVKWNGDVKADVPRCQLVPLDLLHKAIGIVEDVAAYLEPTALKVAPRDPAVRCQRCGARHIEHDREPIGFTCPDREGVFVPPAENGSSSPSEASAGTLPPDELKTISPSPHQPGGVKR